MKRFHEFERSDDYSTRLLTTLDVRTRRRSFLVLVRLMPKLVWSGIRYFPIATIFSNVTNFIPIIASDLKKIFGLEDPFKSRILRYTFSQSVGHDRHRVPTIVAMFFLFPYIQSWI